MRSALIIALALFTTATGWAQPASERKIAQLEKAVEAAEVEFKEQNTRLRKVYRELDRSLESAAGTESAARVAADIKRVMAPVLKAAREQAGKRGSSSQAKARSIIKSRMPKALAKLEVAPFKDLQGYVFDQFNAFVAEADSVKDALSLADEEIAQRMVREALDQAIPFYERWNGGLNAAAVGAAEFRTAHKKLNDARVALAIAKEPLLRFQIGCDEGFARVPAGTYTVHGTAGFVSIRKKPRKAPLDREVWIGLYEVTNEQYLAWLEILSAEDRKANLPRDEDNKIIWPFIADLNKHLPEEEILKHPVVGISLKSACMYALSLGCRLPTEAEWCAMAASKELLPYPWGESWEVDRCNDREAGLKTTTPVGSYPNGRGPFGHYDVAGNAAEWVLTYEDGKNVAMNDVLGGALQQDTVIVRGGSFADGKTNVQTGWVWVKRGLHDRDKVTGFRLAKDAPQ